MITIIIIEDDDEIRQIEKDYLINEKFNVLEAKDGLEGLNLVKQNLDKVSLVLLDLNLPKIDGIELCKRLRQISKIPIIMVTAKTKETDELQGLNLGADDYVKKPFSPKVLVARIKALLKRPSDFIQDIIKINELEINLQKQTVSKNNNVLNITTIQFNILLNMIKNKGKVFKRYELIDKSYYNSQDIDIFDRTIDSHIKNIRKQIEDNPKKPKYILTIRSAGYKFNDKT